MKGIFTIFFLTVICLVFTNQTLAQAFDYSKYKPKTLLELVEINSITSDIKSEFLISGDWFYSQIRLKYIGTSRPISAHHREILKAWKTSFKIPDETVNLFEKEFLFTECNNEYWLPVQKQVAAFFPKELKEGEMITVYLFLSGGVKNEGKWDFLFLVNEFDK
jgi:hypothetical protein